MDNDKLKEALQALNNGIQYLTSIESHLNDADENKIFGCCDHIYTAIKLIKEVKE